MPTDYPPQGPERMTLFYCDAHGWTDRVFTHTDRWYCRACFDANPDAAYAPVETVEYVPRSLAVELAEELEENWRSGHDQACQCKNPDSFGCLFKRGPALSRAKKAGLLGTE